MRYTLHQRVIDRLPLERAKHLRIETYKPSVLLRLLRGPLTNT